ncbi:MAG: flagellar filament capping protein FliD, partial [Pirellulaceae bacterium]
MARIQSSVGLTTGIPIMDTVDQLIAISARPRDLLLGRTSQLRAQQVAFTELTALIAGVEFSVQKLGSSELFNKKTVASSDDTLLAPTVTGSPAAGAYRFTPVRQAQSHQLISNGIASDDSPLGAGEMVLRFGGFVDESVSLDELNGGADVQRGKIRITDRGGNQSIVDLRFAMSIGDVLNAINTNSDINVTASAEGDQLRLTDNTGQTASNLIVQEIGLGTTAADLGLGSVNVANSTALGQDILRLYDNLSLDRLNDGTGISLSQGAADLQVTFADGSTPLQIEFLAVSQGETNSTATTAAANGVDAQIQFTSVGTGENYDGYDIQFVDDETITSGQETVDFDAVSKRITFRIDAGNTRAYDVINALNDDATANQYFTAAAPSGGNATGLVDPSDSATTSGGAVEYRNESTVGALLQTINAADPTRLRAQISSSGDGIELIDLTSGAGTFSVTSLYGGTTAEDLGFSQPASGGVITGDRRLGGLQTVLLDSLAGGYGLGQLGLLSLTDRSGNVTSVDLSSEETVDGVIQAINGLASAITASVNEARNGILLTDTSGGTGNLIVANGDATNTADALGIAVNDAVDSINSGSLNRQTFDEQMTLDSLNQGQGIARGSFLITDSQGQVGAVNLTVSGAETVGDVLELINGLSIGVDARINETGDGILLVDTAGGSGTLNVDEAGSGTTATDLKIAGLATTVDLNGTPTQVIDGATSIRITLDADDTLRDLVSKINESDAGISASLFNSGYGSAPFRLSLVSQSTGTEGAMQFDASQLGLNFQEIVAAQDAVLMLGSADAPIAGVLASSSSNNFEGLIEGVSVSINGTSTSDVTITVESTDEGVTSQIDLFVEQYNNVRAKIDDLTFFDEIENTTGILFGTNEALRVDVDLARIVTSRILGAGPIQSLVEIGLSLSDTGKMTFDKQRFRDQYAASPEDVEQFFSQEEFGAAARIEKVAKQLAGENHSLLLTRLESLQVKINSNEQRIADFNASLDRERESLLNEFYQMELAISRLQSNLGALSQIQSLA